MSGPSAGAGTRLEEIEARLETLTHLEGIVNAMRGIVNLRLREALERLDGIRAYASTVGTAIGEVLTLAPPPPAPPRPPQAARLVIAIAGEQSFTGAFTRRIVERAASLLRGGGEAGPGRGGEVLLVGSRGLRIAGELGLDVAWAAPMSARIDDIPSLADRLAAALYERVAEAGALTVLLVHAVGRSGIAGPDEGASGHGQGSLRVQRLLPFDFGRFPRALRKQPPLVNLPPGLLLEQLAREYIYAELVEALALAHAAESEARLRAMTGARSNIAHMRGELERRVRELRQARVTAEVLELAAGRRARRRVASGPDGAGRGSR